MRPLNTRQGSNPTTPNATTSPMMSPLNRHARTSSSNVGNVKKAQQTKAAAARLAAMMANQNPAADDGDDDDDDLAFAYNARSSGVGGVGMAGGRSVKPRSPMTGAVAQAATQRSTQYMASPSLSDDNDDDDLVSESDARISIGLGGRRSMRTRSPMTKPSPQVLSQKVITQAKPSQPANDDQEESEISSSHGSSNKIIGRAGGRSMRSRSPMISNASQTSLKHVQAKGSQASGDDDDEDGDLGLMCGSPSIGLVGARAARGRSPMPVQEQSGARSSVSANSTEQPRSPLIGRPLKPVKTAEQPLSARSTTLSSQPNNSAEQPPSARSLATGGRPHLGVKTVAMVPSSVPITIKPTSSALPVGSPISNRRDSRLSLDLGNVSNAREAGSVSALQDEIDMLQEENEGLLEKLRFAEERCEESDARAEQLAKQVANLGEGVSLEARLLSRKEAALQQREAALKVIEQTHGGGRPEEIAALRTEAETARDEAVSAFEQLNHAHSDIKSLQNMTKRMILTEDEMEEVILKRCWLSRYWTFCVQHGIHGEIAKAKFEYWSSLAPLPVEVVLAAGQRAQEEEPFENNDVEQRDQALKDAKEISGEGTVESMLHVEKALRELAALKVQEAVGLVMANRRRVNSLKAATSDEVKLPIEGQYEAFELSQEESEDVRFKQAWLVYFWRRAKDHDIEPDLAEERLQYWISHSERSTASFDAVDVERGLMELKKLNIENQLWIESRRGLEQDNTTKPQVEVNF
ncbi:hypothetical protein ACFE04_028428 [Oxalis oulophora]